VDGGFHSFTSMLFSPWLYAAESRQWPFGGLIMPAPLSNEMAALLRVLENVERAIHQRPISTLQELAKLHDETKLKVANSASEDRYANPLVERIATAMLKLRNQAG